MTKADMIQELLDEMRSWDEERIRRWALDLRADDLWESSDETVLDYYISTFGDRP